MKVVQLLDKRRAQWQELEAICEGLQTRRTKAPPNVMLRFAELYRSACADLALADSYQLPANTTQYLHRLVARAHNQLYRSRKFNLHSWTNLLFVKAPQTIFNDRCVQCAFLFFWAVFTLSAYLAYSQDRWPNYAEEIVSKQGLQQMEDMFKEPIGGRSPGDGLGAAGFYIYHNTGIGLKCFAGGLLVVPGMFVTTFNAAFLGASFGYMAREDIASGDNFFHFVTAHGPFELTAIVLSAGAGLRIGMSWIFTGGLSRLASLRRTANYAMPIMGAAMVFFAAAAFIEGIISPSDLPYWSKALVATLSSGLLVFYFVVLGFPRRTSVLWYVAARQNSHRHPGTPFSGLGRSLVANPSS